MKFYLTLAVVVLSTLFIDCIPRRSSVDGPPLRTDEEYEDRKARDDDRRSVLDRSKSRFSGPTCEEEAERDNSHQCVEDCREIYGRRSDRDDCEELPIKQIEILVKLYEDLEDPDDDVLADLDIEDVQVYLNVSIASFEKLIRKYSGRDAKELLLWIAENEDVTEVFEKEDDDFEILKALLNEVENFSGSTVHEPFKETIDSGDKLMEIAIQAGNENALTWFQEFIMEISTACESEESSVGCLTHFCQIGSEMDEDNRQDWLGFESFEKFLEDIIDEGTNGASSETANCWSTTDITDPGDVNDFYIDICKTLADGTEC